MQNKNLIKLLLIFLKKLLKSNLKKIRSMKILDNITRNENKTLKKSLTTLRQNNKTLPSA